MKKRVLLTLLIFLPLVMTSQIDRITEAEIQEQGRFLDALQLRILEKYDEAIEAFLALVEEDPDNDVVHFELARLYYVKGQDEDAVQHAKKAISFNGSKPIYREFLIDLLSGSNDFNELILQLRNYIDAGNFDEKYYFKLIHNYQVIRDFKSALNVLDELEDRVGYKKSIGQKRAGIYRQQNKKRSLLKELDRLSENFPDDTAVLLQVATLMQSTGEDDKAFELYNKILEIDPNHVAANTQLVRWNKKASTEAEFLSAVGPLINNPNIPLDDKIRQLVPFIPRLEQGGQLLTEMLGIMERLNVMYPDDAKVNALYGDVYFNSGDLQQAIPYYQKTLKLNKGVFMVWKNLMLAQDNTRDFKGLKSTAETAVDYFPNQSVCYYYAGKANIELGSQVEGMDWLQEGFLMVGNNPILTSEYHLMMAYFYILEGKTSPAMNQFNKVNAPLLGPRHSFYFEVKGDLEYSQNKYDEAVESWKQSLINGGNKLRLDKKINNVVKQ